MSSPSLRDAETSLLERRRAQRGNHSLGDELDLALLSALHTLTPDASGDARASGRRLGEHVYSRRFLDADLPGAVAALSSALAASGAGTLHVADALHRRATVHFEPAPRLAPADPIVQRAYVAGILEGFLASAFNCEARVEARADALDVLLGAGRDVNGARPRGSVA